MKSEREHLVGVVDAMRGSSARLLMAVGGLGVLGTLASAQCDPRWHTTDGVGGTDPAVYAMTVWDRDGEGPLQPLLVIAGVFTQVGATPANYIAAWDGTGWSSLGTGMDDYVNSLAVMANGDLVAGGAFTTAGGTTVNRVARYDGSSWSALGAGMNNTVQAVAVLTNGDVVAGGMFSTAGGNAVNRIARWNGTSWSAMGVMNNIVWTLLALPNGELVAGGQFTYTASVPGNKIARWTGSAWTGMGTPNNTVLSLGLAPNGDVIAGGLFTYVGVGASRIARYNFSSGWSAMAGGINGPVWAIRSLQDGTIVAGGTFLIADGQYINGITQWTGSSWAPMGVGMENPPNVLAVAQMPNGDMFAGGGFTTVDGMLSPGLARWAVPDGPAIAAQPQSVTSCASAPASFGVSATGGDPLAYAWQAELDAGSWTDLSDGPLYHNSILLGTITGSGTAGVQIASMSQFRQDRMDLNLRCVVSNGCGSATSEPANLTVCPADFDCSGFVDIEDFSGFVLAFEAGTDNADFDGTGFVDTEDYDAFVRAFESGC